MTYSLAIGDRSYSSWSLRAWLLFEKFDIQVKLHHVDFSQGDVAGKLGAFHPARTVPALKLPSGTIVSESLAIAEEMASRHPDAGHWPADPDRRATARALSSEMHAGFEALRTNCPMNLRTAYSDAKPTDAVKSDLSRIEEIWSDALRASDGPWLCGTYSIADAFYAPIAARIAGYNLAVGDAANGYIAQHLADGAFRRWRAMGLAKGQTLPWYDRDYPQMAWPGPAPLVAIRSEIEKSENETCPYSGDPVTHFLEIKGRTFGFCNAFCRDKTLADPEAWPAFMAIYHS